MRRGRQQEQGITSTGQNLGKASSLRILGVLDVAGVREMVGFVDDDDVVAGPIELVEDPLLLQEVDLHEAEGDEVERIRAEFRAPPDFLELRPVDDFQSKPEALSHLETPLFEQRAGGRHDEYSVSKPSGHELRDHQAGLDRLAQPNRVREEQPDPAATDGPQDWNELVGFDPQPSRLDGKQCCGPQGLLE